MSLVAVTAAEERERVTRIVEAIAELIAPGEDKKVQRGKIAAMTGIPARRMKDLALGAVNEPSSHQVRTLENAFRVARVMAPEQRERERDDIEKLISARPVRALRLRGADAQWSRVAPRRRD